VRRLEVAVDQRCGDCHGSAQRQVTSPLSLEGMQWIDNFQMLARSGKLE
jgi:hypothetical protein